MTEHHQGESGPNGTLQGPPTPALNDLNRYQIESKLGNGAHGVVMKAKDIVTDQHVAIKFTYQQNDNVEEF
jgi:serine/threonine protein kinase